MRAHPSGVSGRRRALTPPPGRISTVRRRGDHRLRCSWSAYRPCARPAVGVTNASWGRRPICLPCADSHGIPIEPYATEASR